MERGMPEKMELTMCQIKLGVPRLSLSNLLWHSARAETYVTGRYSS